MERGAAAEGTKQGSSDTMRLHVAEPQPPLAGQLTRLSTYAVTKASSPSQVSMLDLHRRCGCAPKPRQGVSVPALRWDRRRLCASRDRSGRERRCVPTIGAGCRGLSPGRSIARQGAPARPEQGRRSLAPLCRLPRFGATSGLGPARGGGSPWSLRRGSLPRPRVAALRRPAALHGQPAPAWKAKVGATPSKVERAAPFPEAGGP